MQGRAEAVPDREIACRGCQLHSVIIYYINYCPVQYFFLAMDPCRNLGGPGFLLSQIGSHAASRFGERLAPLQLTPADAGILRMLSSSPGISQQELAGRLRVHPTRLVALIDGLEQRSLVERRPNPDDRRQYSLFLTPQGEDLLHKVGRAARDHQEDLLRSLTKQEREHLIVLLHKIADDQGLAPGVHPGYSRQR